MQRKPGWNGLVICIKKEVKGDLAGKICVVKLIDGSEVRVPITAESENHGYSELALFDCKGPKAVEGSEVEIQECEDESSDSS